MTPTSVPRGPTSVERLQARLGAAQDEGVDVVGALVGVDRLEVLGGTWYSSWMPLPPCMSRAMRAISRALPQLLRLTSDIISGAARPSSNRRPTEGSPAGRG